MTKYLFADGCVFRHRTEVEAVDHEAVLGCAAEEAAVEARFGELEKKGVVGVFADGHEIAAALLTEKEGIEAYFARGEYIVAKWGGEGQQRAEKTAGVYACVGNGDATVAQSGEYHLYVLTVFVVAAGGHGSVDKMQAAPRILAVGKLGADVAYHIE